MLPPEHQAFERLTQRIAPQGQLRQVWQLSGGISAGMTALEIKHSDGQASKLIVRRPGAGALRRNPRAARDEFKVLQLAHALGLAAQTPYYLDESGTLFATPYLVVEYVEGAPSFAPAPPANAIEQLATQLAAIHRADYSQHDVSFLRSWPGGFAATFGECTSAIDRMPDEGRIRAMLASVWPLPHHNRPAFLHGDYWPGNILWRDGTLMAVIDWEDAHIGDPLSDLAISRLDLAWIFGAEAMQTFMHYYRSMMPIDYTYLPYWDLYAALRLVRLASADLAGWAAFFQPFGRPDISDQTILEHYRWFVTQAFAALSTH